MKGEIIRKEMKFGVYELLSDREIYNIEKSVYGFVKLYEKKLFENITEKRFTEMKQGPNVGQIGPEIGHILKFLRLMFSTF